MKKSLIVFLLFTAFGGLLQAQNRTNLFRNGNLETLKEWQKIGSVAAEQNGVVRIKPDWKHASQPYVVHGGIAQYGVKVPAPGWYEVSITLKGKNLEGFTFWNQLKLKNKSFVHRVRSVKFNAKDLTEYKKYSFTFLVPPHTETLLMQMCVKTSVKAENAEAFMKDPLLRFVRKPSPEARKKPVAKSPGRPDRYTLMAEKYLPEVRKAIAQKKIRLFYNEAWFKEFKRKANEPLIKERLDYVKDKVLSEYKKLISYTDKNNGLQEKRLPGWHPISNFGAVAGKAAFFYYLTGERKWADLSIDLMKRFSSWYRKRIAMKRSVNWYGWGRVLHVMAWDYLYDLMSKKDRDAIAADLIEHTRFLMDRRKVAKLLNVGEGLNDAGAGFYSAQCMMPWYFGVAFLNRGYHDALAEEALKKGLAGHLEMLSRRSTMAGDDGGSVNSVPAYCYGTYNHVEFWFYFSYMTLTGKNIADDFPQMKLFPFWLTYAIFTGIDNLTYEFGSGSGWHIDNYFMPQSVYHSLFRNFYKGPACDLSDVIHASTPWKKGSWTPLHFLTHFTASNHPFYVFFDQNRIKTAKRDPAFYNSLPKGYFFEQLGQVYMHSGWDNTATRAMFTCGAKSRSHKEADENNFVIYKGGFLALDSGTRSLDSSQKGHALYFAHDNNYRNQSIAHNVVLIKMEGERFPTWNYDPKKVINHAGMNKTIGGVVRAFETNKDFTYAVGDSTACYNSKKARKVVRQFLMIYPDMFVIYDRVISVKASQKKTFLLHTKEEPLVKGNSFEVIQNQGRLICRTLLPEKANLVKVGGPGKEFTVEGVNFPLTEKATKRLVDQAKKARRDAPMWGAYRMEITDKAPKADNTFLHVIQVGLKKDFKSMIDVKLVRKNKMEGASFTYNGTDYTILFDPVKIPSGHIKAVRKGKTLYNRSFTNKVQAQKAADYLK